MHRNTDSVMFFFGTQIDPLIVVRGNVRIRRELGVLLKSRVLRGSGLALEDAEFLIELYGRRELGWPDPLADSEGFITFTDANRSLVHNYALLSRRIADLETGGLVETKQTKSLKSQAKAGVITDSKNKSVRITDPGIRRILPIYERYGKLCERLLRSVRLEDQLTYIRVNESMMGELRGEPS